MQTDNIGAKAAGVVFPPIVFFDGADYWLADGFHRLIAAEELGLTEFDADVREGTRRDPLCSRRQRRPWPEAVEQVQAQRRDDAAEGPGVVRLVGSGNRPALRRFGSFRQWHQGRAHSEYSQ